jgi:hypothetical protein
VVQKLKQIPIEEICKQAWLDVEKAKSYMGVFSFRGVAWKLELVEENGIQLLHHPDDDSSEWIAVPDGILKLGMHPEIAGSGIHEDHGIAQLFVGDLGEPEQVYDMDGKHYKFYRVTR